MLHSKLFEFSSKTANRIGWNRHDPRNITLDRPLSITLERPRFVILDNPGSIRLGANVIDITLEKEQFAKFKAEIEAQELEKCPQNNPKTS